MKDSQGNPRLFAKEHLQKTLIVPPSLDRAHGDTSLRKDCLFFDYDLFLHKALFLKGRDKKLIAMEKG